MWGGKLAHRGFFKQCEWLPLRLAQYYQPPLVVGTDIVPSSITLSVSASVISDITISRTHNHHGIMYALSGNVKAANDKPLRVVIRVFVSPLEIEMEAAGKDYKPVGSFDQYLWGQLILLCSASMWEHHGYVIIIKVGQREHNGLIYG